MHKRWKSIETLANPTEDWSVHGSAPAVVAYGEGGKRIWSYEELSSCVCQIAAGLRRKGIGKNDLILLISENSPEWIACCLAVLTAGATIVPIDASTDERTLTSTLKNLKVRLVFTSKENSDRLERLVEIPHEDFVILDNGADDRHWKNLLAEATDMQVTIEPEMVAAIFFTSGTTGTPKGVPLTHGNLAFQINSLASIPQLVHDDDRVLLPLPLHHIYPFVIGMLLPLACGRPIILPGHLTGTHLMKVIRSERVTAIIGVPRLYEALLAGIQDRLDSLTGIASIMRLLLRLCIWCRRRLGFSPGRIFLFALHREIGPDLKTLTCGGASIDPDLAFALVGFGWRLAIGYGLSETSPLLTLLVPGQRRVDTVGRPLKGVELKIAKFKSTRDEGRDSLAVAGEILARGPGVFSGYLPDPGGIPGKEVFTEDGWFHTGDLGFMEEGYLKIAGRASCVIISRTGKKIDPEILEASYSEDPFISEIGILSYEGKLVSVVVPDLNAIKGSGYHSIQTAVHNAIDRRSLDLPSYKRLSGFRVCRKPLERTTMGKIQRHHLATLYRELSQSSGRRSALAQEAPMTESDFLLLAHPEAKKVYEYLADRYGRETLNLDASVQLDLGIDSLEWLTLQLAISDKTGVSFDESDILNFSTVRDLLRVIAGKVGQQDIETRNLFESPEKLLIKGLKHW
ncbi:MAG: AMP-binding protein, partial [Candidatus Obscuribacterales bacterium]